MPLPEEVIRKGLSQLGRTKDGLSTAFLRLELQGVPVSSSADVSHLVHIQTLKINGGGLEETEKLGSMAGLVHLDVADNALTELLNIRDPPASLLHADLSGNRIESIAGDYVLYPSLRTLLLSRNPLHSVQGLETLPSLEHLSLANCQLTSVEGLAPITQLRSLDLTGNQLSSLEPLKHMTRLEQLSCGENYVRDLRGLEGLESLRALDLHDNCLGSHEALSSLRRLSQLSTLDVRGNRLTDVANARLHVLFLIPQLATLNDVATSPQEKVDGANLHGADLQDLRAIRAHFFPNGELDDLGGAPPSLTTPLTAEEGLQDAGRLVISEALTVRVAAVVEAAGVYAAQGVKHLAMHLKDAAQSLDPDVLVQCCYLWVVHAVKLPPDNDTWDTSCPLFIESLAPFEKDILTHEEDRKGAWSERVSRLFTRLLHAMHIDALETELVHGTIRPRWIRPGERLLMHNHCWTAVKLHDKWRLLDCSLGAIPNWKWRFFTPPIEMCLTHMPLMNRWQLMGPSPKSREEFWSSPVSTPAYYTLHVGSPADPLLRPSVISATAPLFSLMHTAPVGTALYNELLDTNMQPVRFDYSAGVPAGSYTFSHVLHSVNADAVSPRRASMTVDGAPASRDTWELWTSLPKAGEYFLRVWALIPAESEEPIELITYRVVFEGEATASGPLLPNVHRQWLYTRCQLNEPHPGQSMYFGADVQFGITTPRPVLRPAVGVPGGHKFINLLPKGYEDEEDPRRLPRDQLTVYNAIAELPAEANADSFVITAESEDCPGVFAPLCHFKLVPSPTPIIKTRESVHSVAASEHTAVTAPTSTANSNYIEDIGSEPSDY